MLNTIYKLKVLIINAGINCKFKNMEELGQQKGFSPVNFVVKRKSISFFYPVGCINLSSSHFYGVKLRFENLEEWI